MKNILRFFILILFFGIQSVYVYGYNIRKITNLENLSNNSVTSLCQDEKGILWIGTCDGLNSYNGYKISLFQSQNQDEVLSGSLIDKITAIDNSLLWVQTYYGIDLIDKEKQTLEKYNEFNKVLFTQKDSDEDFYIIKEDGCIFYFDKKEKRFNKILTPEIIFSKILYFFIDTQNVIKIINKDGSFLNYRIDKNSKNEIELKREKDYQHSRNIIFCSEHDEGFVFVDDKHDIYEFNSMKQKVSFIINVKDLIAENGVISSIIKFHDDYFIGFKTNGLFRLRSDIYGYSTEKIPVNSGVFCLLKDKYQDLIWIGTDGQGVYSYSIDQYSIHSVLLNNLSFKINRPVRAIYKDDENTLWLGSKGDGIFKIHNYNIHKDIQEYKTEYITTSNSSLWDNSIYSFSRSKQNIIWIGTEEGLNYYSPKDKRIKRVSLNDNGIDIKYIHDIYEQDSLLWIASVGMGIVKAKIDWQGENPILKVEKRYLINKGDISSNYFFSFFVDDKIIWVANRGSGIFKINTDTDSIENITFNSNTLNEIYSISKDSDGNYLIGTSFGLIKYKDIDHYKIMNKSSGFPSNVIHCILPEEDGSFWLSTNNGIINYNSKYDSFRKYNYIDRIDIFEFSDGAVYNDAETGSIFFGGINGFISILENEDYRASDYVPSIYSDDLEIFGKKYNLSQFVTTKDNVKTLTLNYDQNFFSITFNVIDYLNRGNYNFQYKLEEINSQWVDNGNSSTISLINFASGEYTLLVKYHNMALDKESSIYSIKIKILPPWYKTNLAYMLYGLLALFFLGLIIRSFIIREKKKKIKTLRVLEQKHKEDVYESKLRFFTNIAHEFCTPLTLIYGPCNRILNQKNSDKTIVKYTQIIQQNAERLNKLIQDLIEFRRIETGHKTVNIEFININELITHVANAFTDMAESREIDLDINMPHEISYNSDKEFLITIITNLLSNAFKYTPDKGSVKIITEQSDGELRISISNIGKGIEKEDISKIFDRYSVLENFENQQDSRLSSRNGLGLAISNSMVNLLGGKIEIDSQPNEWTHFTVNLPSMDSAYSGEKKQGLPEVKNMSIENINVTIPHTAYDDLKPTLLIIDDEPEILWLIRDIFIDEFNIITADSISDALLILDDVHPEAILCDIMISGMDGIAFVKQVKENPEIAHIPLILISAKHEIDKQIEGMDAGAELYITKPFNTDYLKTSVKQLISRKETFKDYFTSPKSAYEVVHGKLKHKEHKKIIKEILDIINKNIQQKDLSVNIIAEKMNMSTRSLYRKLNEIDDVNIPEMIRDCRLHIAHDLLIKSKLTVGEIVFKSGFSNRVSFFKAFSKKYNCTPKEYRDMHI